MMSTTTRETIAIVEDEPDLREVLEYNLAREGFRILMAGDGEEGWELVRRERPALVILDLMLPGMDGTEISRRMQQDPDTRTIPVLMLTAKSEETDVLVGFAIGADDYVTKPFRPKELIARVKAVLRRSAMRAEAASGERINHGRLVIDAGRHEVRIDGDAIELTATEFRLLHFLALHPGRVFTRDQLLSRVIGEDAVVIDRNIDVHVRSIRKKLGELRGVIETVRGVGYRFTGQSRE